MMRQLGAARLRARKPGEPDAGMFGVVPGVVPFLPTGQDGANELPGEWTGFPMPARPRSTIIDAIAGAQAPSEGSQLGALIAQSAALEPQPPTSVLANAIGQSVADDGRATPAPTGGIGLGEAKKPGFFQKGGVGQKILKGLGEFSLRYSAGQGDPYATMVLRNRFEERQQQARLIEQVKARQAERGEWMWREQWKRQHPDDQFTQYMQAAGIDPGSPQGQALYRQRAETMAAPPMMAVDGFDPQGNPTKTFMPRTLGGASQPAGAGPAVGTVRNGFRFKGGNPNDPRAWEPAGGAPSQGGAPFR